MRSRLLGASCRRSARPAGSGRARAPPPSRARPAGAGRARAGRPCASAMSPIPSRSIASARALAPRRALAVPRPAAEPDALPTPSARRTRSGTWVLMPMPSRAIAIGSRPVDVAAAEQDPARRRPELAGQALEEGALARAVRPDQAAQLALAQGEVDMVDGDDAAEAHRERPVSSSAVTRDRRTRPSSRPRRRQQPLGSSSTTTTG